MMQLVIPMSGYGERFRQAGYRIPKPLIEVNGRPIIGHVLDMFPGISDPIFICNKEHLAEPDFRMAEILHELCPGGRIVAIDPHSLGPVHAVLQAAQAIDAERPTVINYCDFTCYWDFEHFKTFVAESNCDGAIPAYTGFHPHMLRSTNFAFVREKDGWVEAIQEKQPYTDTPMREYASSGTYYFRSGKMALDYCRALVDRREDLNGEYYVSLVYRGMLADKRRIAVYPLQHFMQWGTPEDLAVYNSWSRAFETLCSFAAAPSQAGTVMVPMAGAGSRFVQEGYADPKPLVPVSGAPMAVQAVRDLPDAKTRVFVLRADLPGLERIKAALTKNFPAAQFVILDALTRGAAETCLLALDGVDPDAPLTIGACDNGVTYPPERFSFLMKEKDADVIVWVVRGYANAVRKPEMYGWVAAERGKISSVSVKVPLADPASDPVVVGTFTFKRARDFRAAAERLIARGGTTNGEYYVDACVNDAIALGLKCVIMEVDAYISWGTPDELRTFAYWQSCFHKWPRHPYRLEKDFHVVPETRAALAQAYAPVNPPLPRPLP